MPPPGVAEIELDAWIEGFDPVAGRVREALRRAIDVAMDGPARPVDLCEPFDLGRTMAGRIHRVLETDDPVEVALLLPGRPTMMRFIERAGEHCKNEPNVVSELREAYRAFHREVSRVASTHQELRAVLSVHDPRVLRETAEQKRAMAFRALTDLSGGYAEALSAVTIIYPNTSDPSLGDTVSLHGMHGVRRLGVMNAITVSTVASALAQPIGREAKRRIDGSPISPEDGTIVRELSSANLPALRAFPTERAVYSVFAGEDLPLGETVDLVAGSIQEGWVRNFREGEHGTEQASGNLSTPTKLMHGELLVHKDMWPGIEPEYRAYNTLAIPEDSFPGDFWFREVENCGEFGAISASRLLEPITGLANHARMLRYAIDQTGIDLADFRIYRMTIRYPVVGHSYWVYFSRRDGSSSRGG